MTNEQKPHEYAPFQWVALGSVRVGGKPIVSLPNLKGRDLTGKEIDLVNTYSKNSKVLILSFFAEWCSNCQYEATQIKKLFSDYNSFGLNMVLIMDYSSQENALSFVNKHELEMPMVFGELDEKNEEKRSNTQFYQFRKALGDGRGWGTPFHIIIENGNTNKVGIIMGEIIEKQIQQYIAETLLTDSLFKE